jgi:CubicO group peptidase (beta-lactamase class C family)
MALPIALTACSTSAKSAAPAERSRVDQIVDGLARPFSASMPAGGLSIGILTAGEIHTFHYGDVDGLGNPPTDSTLYTVGSITKTFTTTLLAQAVIAGRVRLTDDIRDHLDGDYPNLAYDSQPIRLVHLANHRSGLPAHLPAMPPPNSGQSEIERTALERSALSSYTRSDFLRDLRRVELTSVPGSQFHYSNAGTQLLAHILERVYGRSYEELVEANIARPLGMGSTTFDAISNGGPPARGYNADGVAVPNNAAYMSAAAGLRSTVVDMLRYARWQLEDADPAVALTHEPTWSHAKYSFAQG